VRKSSFLEANENANKTYQNLCDTAKSVLRGKFTAISVCIKSTERSQIIELMVYLKLLEKQEQAIPKTSRKREIIKTRAQITETRDQTTSYKESLKQKASSLKNKQD
jgi:hypothetical protein